MLGAVLLSDNLVFVFLRSIEGALPSTESRRHLAHSWGRLRGALLA